MRSFKTEGIVIRRRNFGESDRLVTILSLEHGKMVLKAKGVRKITSKRSSHVELLNHSTITAYTANTFPLLIEASMIDDYSSIKTDLVKIGAAYHMCELIDSLCPEWVEYDSVFELLKSSLVKLANYDYTTVITHDFEISLLSILGYWHGSIELAKQLDTERFVENIIERKLKSKQVFAKIQ